MDMKPRRTRREVLALVASGSVVGSAGCLSDSEESAATDSEDGESTATPTPDPTVPDVDCDPAEHSSLSTEIPEGAWSPTRGNQRRTGANHDMEPLGLDEVDELEATEMFSASTVSLPAIADGTIYVTDNDEVSHAVDVESGETQWRLFTKGFETPVVTTDSVYFSGLDVLVSAIDREDGTFRWTRHLPHGEAITTAPIIAGGNLIVGYNEDHGDDEQGWCTALDLQCGSERWTSVFDQQSPQGIATDQDTVYMATDHHLYALDAQDGTEHWRTRVTDEHLDYEVPPVLAGETVILKDQDSLYALSTVDGSERWNTVGNLEVEHPPTVTSDTVYVVESETNDVLALDMETGETRWRYRDVPGEVNSALTEVSGTVYVAGDLERDPFRFGILALDASTGTKQADATLQPLDGANARTISELAITPAGIVTHAGTTEGGNPELIYRIHPD